MASPTFVPIDPPLAEDKLRLLTPEQLRNRDILDPRFAGFDPRFDWHAFVELEAANPRLIAALDKISIHPLGQQVIRQAFALHQKLLEQGESDPAVAAQLGHTNPKIMVGESFERTGSSPSAGRVDINFSELDARPYFGTDCHTHSMQPDSVLFHEFGHLADAFNVLPAYSAKREEILQDNLAMRSAVLRYAGLDPQKPYRLDEVNPVQRAILDRLANERESMDERAVLRVTNDYLRSVGEPERSLVPQFFLEQPESPSYCPMSARNTPPILR